MLIDKGAKLNARNEDYETPLHLAAREGHKDMVERLLMEGALIDVKDKHDKTPEMLARENDKEEVARLIDWYGENVSLMEVSSSQEQATPKGHDRGAGLAIWTFIALSAALLFVDLIVVLILLKKRGSAAAAKGGAVAVLFTAAFLGAMGYVLREQCKTFAAESTKLRKLIAEARRDPAEIHRDIREKKRILAKARREMITGVKVPHSLDMDAYIKDLESLGEHVINHVDVTAKEVETIEKDSGIRATRLKVRITITPERKTENNEWYGPGSVYLKEEVVISKFKPEFTKYLDEWKVTDVDGESAILSVLVYEFPETLTDPDCQTLTSDCRVLHTDVWLWPYAGRIEELHQEYQKHCRELDRIRGLDMELCRLDHYIADALYRIRIKKGQIEETQSRMMDYVSVQAMKLRNSIKCRVSEAVPIDGVYTDYEVNEVRFCRSYKEKGVRKSVIAVPGQRNYIVKKGDHNIGRYGGRVLAIEDDRILVEETYIKKGEEKMITITYELHNSFADMEVKKVTEPLY